MLADKCGDGSPSGFRGDLLAVIILDGAMAAISSFNIVLDIAVLIMDHSRDVAEKACKQDFAGVNASTACVPFEVSYHVVKGINDLTKSARRLLGDAKNILKSSVALGESDDFDDSEACRKKIKDNTDTLKTDTMTLISATTNPDNNSTVKEDTENLKISAGNTEDALGRIEAELAEMKNLLLTPQGKREGFSR